MKSHPDERAMKTNVNSIKNGQMHLASINDDRTIMLEGARVHDVAAHPAFRQSAQTVASLYDFQAAHPERMTFDIGKGKLFVMGPEITQRAQSYGTFKFLFNGLLYGPAVSGK